MSFCPKCGTKSEERDKFCSKCGTDLKPIVPATSVKQGALMRNGVKRISAIIFGIALICFLLPFISVSCKGIEVEVETFTGIQLATGTTIENPNKFGEEGHEIIDAEPLAVLAFIAGLFGLILSFSRGKKSVILPAIMGVAGVILLLLLKNKIDNIIVQEGLGLLQVKYGIGFWLTFLLYFFTAGFNLIFLFTQGNKLKEKLESSL